MNIESIGLQRPDLADPTELRGLRDEGRRFSVDHLSGPDAPHEVDRALSQSERANENRRRPPVRYSRRTSEIHAQKEVHGKEEAQRTERGELRIGPGEYSQPEEEGGSGPGGTGEDQEHAADADFEALTAHLLRLGGPIREVTLYLPSLGRVTARMDAGAISIVVDVPRSLLPAVRRGEKDLVEQMGRQGLRIARLEIEVHDDAEPEERRSRQGLRTAWPTRGLVDVMA